MRFLIYGESWRGAMPYSANQALQKLGHETIIFDPTLYLLSQRFHNKAGTVLDRLLFHQVANKINQELQKLLLEQSFDVLLVFKGLYLWPETVQVARKRCQWAINWNWDEFFNPVHRSPYMADAFKLYNLILTSRQHLIPDYLLQGARQVEYFQFCFDPEIHYPVSVAEDERGYWGGDIIFVGSWSRRREEILSHLSDIKLKIWGSSWKHAGKNFKSSPNVQIGKGTAGCEDMSRALNASKIGLNIMTLENRDQTNLRNFEIPACGVFQLCERTAALKELFNEGEEIVCFESTEELIDKTRYYLTHEEKRKAVAKAGYEKIIKAKHTYLDRMEQLIALLKK